MRKGFRTVISIVRKAVGMMGATAALRSSPAPERRRRWPADAKARITAESFKPNVSVSEVARRHGVSLGLLHSWRRRAREKGRVEALPFVPIAVTDEPPVAAPLETSTAGMIEIDMGGVRIRLSGAVDGAALRTVLAAMRGTV